MNGRETRTRRESGLSRRRVCALMRKDLRALTASSMVLAPMLIVPLLLCILMPAALTLLALRLGQLLVSGAQYLERLLPLYPVPAELPGPTERVLYVFLNYTFLPLFLLVPVMVSTIIAADSIVGEKERRTLETLLYTPISRRELAAAKLLAAFLPAVLVSWGAFAGYFGVLNAIGLAARSIWLVRAWIWLPALLLLAPAVALLALALTLLVSFKARSFMEAQQLAGLVVLPFVALVAAQVSGALVFRPLYVAALALLLAAAGLWIIARAVPRFEREKIISTL
jgi:ABC-type Na+ efflux pump permease subunit